MAHEHSAHAPQAVQVNKQQPRGVHLVGSVPLEDAEAVFRVASATLGGRLRRLPDGETGIRRNWVSWQREVFAGHPLFEQTPPNAAWVADPRRPSPTCCASTAKSRP